MAVLLEKQINCVASSFCSNTGNQWTPSTANALGSVSTEGPLGVGKNPAHLTPQLCTGLQRDGWGQMCAAFIKDPFFPCSCSSLELCMLSPALWA